MYIHIIYIYIHTHPIYATPIWFPPEARAGRRRGAGWGDAVRRVPQREEVIVIVVIVMKMIVIVVIVIISNSITLR